MTKSTHATVHLRLTTNDPRFLARMAGLGLEDLAKNGRQKGLLTKLAQIGFESVMKNGQLAALGASRHGRPPKKSSARSRAMRRAWKRRKAMANKTK